MSMNGNNVEYCENSTITEAWSLVTGTPGAVKDADAGALENIASKSLGDFQPQPSFVVVQQKKDVEIVPPFWHKQLSYGNGKYITRLGHRYLSVHFTRMGENKYDKYKNSLEPQVNIWLDAYAETVRGRSEPDLVESAGFGYINLFRFPASNFDLSEYFKVSFGTGTEFAEAGLAKLDIKFSLNHAETDSRVEVSISVVPEQPESDQIVIVTKIEARKVVRDGFSFEEPHKILDNIGAAKKAAKDVFFDLATMKTHLIMGARYDSSAT